MMNTFRGPNVARHARAREVTVAVCAYERVLRVRIEDRGAGFDLQAALAGHTSRGVVGMRERAVLLGGRIGIETAPGYGTQVHVEFPIGGPDKHVSRRDSHDYHRSGG
jgi:two-component system sensor kinase